MLQQRGSDFHRCVLAQLILQIRTALIQLTPIHKGVFDCLIRGCLQTATPELGTKEFTESTAFAFEGCLKTDLRRQLSFEATHLRFAFAETLPPEIVQLVDRGSE